MPVWTVDQKRVIHSPSQRLICSAAAGSGKTAVMIERIVEQIRGGADPFSFLVITFTNAAASEMCVQRHHVRPLRRGGRPRPPETSSERECVYRGKTFVHSMGATLATARRYNVGSHLRPGAAHERRFPRAGRS